LGEGPKVGLAFATTRHSVWESKMLKFGSLSQTVCVFTVASGTPMIVCSCKWPVISIVIQPLSSDRT